MWHRRLAGVMLLLWVGETHAAVGGETPRWLRELQDQAAQGNLDAQYTLGVRYAHGQGVTRDPAAAVRWLRRAAGQGDTAAQFLLGGIYYRGEEGQPD